MMVRLTLAADSSYGDL